MRPGRQYAHIVSEQQHRARGDEGDVQLEQGAHRSECAVAWLSQPQRNPALPDSNFPKLVRWGSAAAIARPTTTLGTAWRAPIRSHQLANKRMGFLLGCSRPVSRSYANVTPTIMRRLGCERTPHMGCSFQPLVPAQPVRPSDRQWPFVLRCDAKQRLANRTPTLPPPVR